MRVQLLLKKSNKWSSFDAIWNTAPDFIDSFENKSPGKEML